MRPKDQLLANTLYTLITVNLAILYYYKLHNVDSNVIILNIAGKIMFLHFLFQFMHNYPTLSINKHQNKREK